MKRMMALLLALAMVLTLVACAKTEPVGDHPTEVGSEPSAPGDSQTETRKPYDARLKTYRTALEEQWSLVRLNSQRLSPLCLSVAGDDALNQVGYAIMDVMGDETKELIIGLCGPDSELVIFDMYTDEKGYTQRICASTELSRYYLCSVPGEGDAYELLCVDTSNAATTRWTTYYYEDGSLMVSQDVRYDSGNTASPWSMGTLLEGVLTYSSIDEDMAKAAIASAENCSFRPEYTPFSQY